MKEITLLDLAFTDYNAAVLLYNGLKNITDDKLLNLSSYHLEQAIEKTMKFIIENNGFDFPKSHNIESLIYFAENNGIDLYISDYIKEHAEMFSLWESKTRYVTDYFVDSNKVERAIKEIKEYLDLVYLNETENND